MSSGVRPLSLTTAGFRAHHPRKELAPNGFVQDFVSAWTKVMNLDRYDLA